jgi:hypothetical protein
MHLEASHANVENDRIHREFDFRESQTEELIRQQQYSYDELMKIKIEKDVIEISTSILENNIQKLFLRAFPAGFSVNGSFHINEGSFGEFFAFKSS